MTHYNLDGRASLAGLDDWITREPHSPEFDDRPSEEDEIYTDIDNRMQTAKTAEDWLAIVNLAKSVGDQPAIETRDIGWAWHANRPDYDLGSLMGTGRTELAAIADLLEQERNQ